MRPVRGRNLPVAQIFSAQDFLAHQRHHHAVLGIMVKRIGLGEYLHRHHAGGGDGVAERLRTVAVDAPELFREAIQEIVYQDGFWVESEHAIGLSRHGAVGNGIVSVK